VEAGRDTVGALAWWVELADRVGRAVASENPLAAGIADLPAGTTSLRVGGTGVRAGGALAGGRRRGRRRRGRRTVT
jgi:hypothetical protein